MSMDTVDDLQAAEETSELLASILGDILDTLDTNDHTPTPARLSALRVRARDQLAANARACRPTCGFRYDPDREPEDDPCDYYEDGSPACGCPCEHEGQVTP
jgi:hypothetical protein